MCQVGFKIRINFQCSLILQSKRCGQISTQPCCRDCIQMRSNLLDAARQDSIDLITVPSFAANVAENFVKICLKKRCAPKSLRW